MLKASEALDHSCVRQAINCLDGAKATYICMSSQVAQFRKERRKEIKDEFIQLALSACVIVCPAYFRQCICIVIVHSIVIRL